MSALYNENDPYAAQWLRNLIAGAHIAPGVVNERSIKELSPAEVGGAGQRHFFAGVGVWSYALRLAGWSDEDEIWSGSCPCQPWSSAGKGKRHADERHLWPDWFRLIDVHRPRRVVGEQVASPAGLAWLDDVQADLEGAGYAFAAFDLCSAGFGAPHIRQRLYFAAVRLADSDSGTGGQGRADSRGSDSGGDAQSRAGLGGRCGAGGLAHHRREGLAASRVGAGESSGHDADGRGSARGLGHADSIDAGRDTGAGDCPEARDGSGRGGDEPRASGATGRLEHASRSRWGQGGLHVARGAQADRERADDQHRDAGPVNGFWEGADWLLCRDGKWRPVEPGTFPLAHGAPARVGRLRAYGNAIDAHLAAQFLGALRETLDGGAA